MRVQVQVPSCWFSSPNAVAVTLAGDQSRELGAQSGPPGSVLLEFTVLRLLGDCGFLTARPCFYILSGWGEEFLIIYDNVGDSDSVSGNKVY